MVYAADFVKQTAREVGFYQCGISKADFLEEEAPRLEQWLKSNMHGNMQYMENHFDKRLDPRKLVEGSKSVISVLLNYYPSKTQNPEAPKISKYAYGTDYHIVLKERLKELVERMMEKYGSFNFRVFTDSAPVMDKVWAAKSGLGWIGKHSNLISKQAGSFYFIGEIICDLEFETDESIEDFCGTCTKCIDACPTEAITPSYIVDGSKCISYATIELKSDQFIPDSFSGNMDNWAFGCDICQDVCPWNRFSQPHEIPEFDPTQNLMDMTPKDWNEISEEIFNELFKNSPIKRAKYEGLKRNLSFIQKT